MKALDNSAARRQQYMMARDSIVQINKQGSGGCCQAERNKTVCSGRGGQFCSHYKHDLIQSIELRSSLLGEMPPCFGMFPISPDGGTLKTSRALHFYQFQKLF